LAALAGRAAPDEEAAVNYAHFISIAFIGVALILVAGLDSLSSVARPPLSSQGAKTDAASPTGDAQKGRKLFVKNGCYECHGYEGQGGSAGPRLGPDPVPLSALIAYARAPLRDMPPYSEKVISDNDLKDIHAFLSSQPHPSIAAADPRLH
jgi:mono/diheme cytochrome c family protein